MPKKTTKATKTKVAEKKPVQAESEPQAKDFTVQVQATLDFQDIVENKIRRAGAVWTVDADRAKRLTDLGYARVL